MLSNISHPNWRHSPVSVDRIWAEKYLPDQFHAYSFSLTEVNANYLRVYLVDGVDMEPQLDFRRQFGWDMFDNTIYEETEAGGLV